MAGIGLKTGSIDPKEDFGNEGLAWQKDSSWGSYQVTTLHEYEPVIMKNAIIYSDNIYFAKAALKIGSENFMNTLNEIGFNQDMPFEIAMQESTYSNTDKIETEIQLADSGYGQGQWEKISPTNRTGRKSRYVSGNGFWRIAIRWRSVTEQQKRKKKGTGKL